jgi:hypothetical protein
VSKDSIENIALLIGWAGGLSLMVVAALIPEYSEYFSLGFCLFWFSIGYINGKLFNTK